jgi:hypothetical protein
MWGIRRRAATANRDTYGEVEVTEGQHIYRQKDEDPELTDIIEKMKGGQKPK